ncbi:MAG: NAD(P)-dependent alcohol dehydrogenase, partial [Anaerolineae bacterium]|nr:NAD(P)-dependent alcohol dehydrogenase [Anaerolineae bacterium]
LPKENEIRVRVSAASVNYGDILARDFGNLSPRDFNMPMPLWLPVRLSFGVRTPRKPILGSEFAGVVEAVGASVSRFKAGDRVFGYLGQRMGAYAEYLCLPEDGAVALAPRTMTDAEAAAVPYGALMALGLLRRVGIQPGQRVLVNGASGGIGSAAVQLARYWGAEVTGVCSTPRLAMVTALGADRVIDYTRQDFTQEDQTYDLIFDVLGRSSFARCKRVLKPNGVYLLASFKSRQLGEMLWTSVAGTQTVVCALASEKADDLDFIRQLIEAGKYKTIVDRCFPLAQAAEAHRYVEDGHKQGAVVITMT